MSLRNPALLAGPPCAEANRLCDDVEFPLNRRSAGFLNSVHGSVYRVAVACCDGLMQDAEQQFCAGVRRVSLDPYELISMRSTLDFAESMSAGLLDLFPCVGDVKVLRQWAGLCDMTPDFSPIMGTTPIKGFYIDAGWGTWGFKATPISGKTMASTLANDHNHDLIRAFNLSRFKQMELVGEKGAASVGH